MLNTFGDVTRATPTNPQLAAALEQVLEGNRPQRHSVCKRFGLSPGLYDRWLHALFMLFAKDPREPLDLFAWSIKRMFESNHVLMQVFHYTNPDPRCVCLLSDRGFNQPLRDEQLGFAFEFNVSSRAFARLVFCDPVKYAAGRVAPEVAATLRANVRVFSVENDLNELARYNQQTAYQCAERVYAASPNPLLQLS